MTKNGKNNRQIAPLFLEWPGKKVSQERLAAAINACKTAGVDSLIAFRNLLCLGDNLDFMLSLLQKGYSGKVNLIYLDPPFGTGSDLNFAGGSMNVEEKAYKDNWGAGLNVYLQMLWERLILMKELLAEDGSIYVHLDYHVANYIKVILDELFGRENMVNQIVWQRTGGHNDSQAFGRNYDIILFYRKSDKMTWHKPVTGYDEAHLKRYFRKDESGRWYRLNNPTGKGYQDHLRDFGKGPVKPPRDRHWSISQAQVNTWLQENKIVYTSSGYPFVKKFLDEMPGKQVQSIWMDLIPPRSSRELTGYPTQKPEKLLERIIAASSNEGDLVADFFCGSGTTLVAAEKLGRQWLGCDSGEQAIKIAKERLAKACRPGSYELIIPSPQ